MNILLMLALVPYSVCARFYVSGSVCRACIGNCNSCINAQVCTQCAGGFLLLADQARRSEMSVDKWAFQRIQ
jgi:hypothetical protein